MCQSSLIWSVLFVYQRVSIRVRFMHHMRMVYCMSIYQSRQKLRNRNKKFRFNKHNGDFQSHEYFCRCDADESVPIISSCIFIFIDQCSCLFYFLFHLQLISFFFSFSPSIHFISFQVFTFMS